MNSVKLNLAVTRANLNDDSDLIVAIATVVIEDLPLLAVDLRNAFEAKDCELVQLMAHTIKGLASNFQAEPLMQLAQKLETELAELSDADIGRIVMEIMIVSEQTISAIQNELHIED